MPFLTRRETPADPPETSTSAAPGAQGSDRPSRRSSAILIGLFWTIPTFGLFVQSFRGKAAQDTSGWWTGQRRSRSTTTRS